MNPLDLTRVSRLSSYKVWTENGSDYNIETNRGQIFVVGFMDDYSIWQAGAYQFTISNQGNQPSPLDKNLRKTILLLVEAFFAANPDNRAPEPSGRGVVRPTGKEVYRQACPAWYLYPEWKEDHD